MYSIPLELELHSEQTVAGGLVFHLKFIVLLVGDAAAETDHGGKARLKI